MKITITGFTNDPEVVTYTVQQIVRGTVSGTSSLSKPVEKTITGEALNALSQQLPHSQPGQMTDEEILLAGIYDMHYRDDGADLVGKTARMGQGNAAALAERYTESLKGKPLVLGSEMVSLPLERRTPNFTAHPVEIPTEADLDYVQKVAQGLPRALSPGRTPLFALTVGNKAYACYENHTGFPVYINDAEVAGYIGDSLEDAKQFVRRDARGHIDSLLR